MIVQFYAQRCLFQMTKCLNMVSRLMYNNSRLIDVSAMPQICFSADKELIEDINKLAKQYGSRSECIKLLLKAAVAAALGKVPLREGLPPTTNQLLENIRQLEARVEKLEKLGVKVTLLPGKAKKEREVSPK